jgi:hypothetical protein
MALSDGRKRLGLVEAESLYWFVGVLLVPERHRMKDAGGGYVTAHSVKSE